MIKVGYNAVELGGSSVGGGSTTFAGLSDKTTADIPVINTPLAAALSSKEVSTNKKTDVDANKTSNTFFPTVKAVFDWVSGLFVKGTASSTDNAIARFDGTTGKLLKNSNVTISDAGNVGINGSASPINKLIINSSSTGFTEEFKVNNSVDPLGGATRFTISNTQGSLQLNQYGSAVQASLANGAGVFCSGTGNFILGAASTASTANVCLFTNNSFDAPDFRIKQDGDIGIGRGLAAADISARLDVNGTFRSRGNATFNGQIIDNVGSSGVDGQVLKKVGGKVLWSNP